MRSFVPSVAALALLAVNCAGPLHRGPTPDARYARSVLRNTLGDRSAVFRLCVAPDSVLAGRRACELRNQAPRIRVF